MVPVMSVMQMRRVDEKAIGGDVAVGYSYMLRAGMCLCEEAKRLVPDASRGEIAVMCGKGNNGGDGFVAARLLMESGHRVMCFGLCAPDQLKGEAKFAFDQYIAQKGNFLLLDDTTDLRDLSKYSLIIDGLLGTGLSGNPHGIFAETIEAINQSGATVLAIDTPSGLDNDRGVPGVPCVKAHATVAMGFPKIGAFFYPARALVGDYRIKNLGYPDEIVGAIAPDLSYPAFEDLQKLLPKRNPAGSKFDHGVALMVCGSRGMTGSAALSSMAALRTGCGMVHLACPRSTVPVLCAMLKETVVHGMDETEEGALGASAREAILDLCTQARCVCIGPGISHGKETSRLVLELVQNAGKPIILDADGVNAFKDRLLDLKNAASGLLITPHKGEWARLFGPLPPQPLDAIKTLRDKAAEFGMTVLYKGAPTIVADPQGKAFVLPFGNSGMATAGSGDALSGIIASLAAQGLGLTDAAVLGAYVHGEAGNAARDCLNEYSMIAGDIVENIYKAINTLIEE